MATSLIRSRAMITRAIDRKSWREIRTAPCCRRTARSSPSAPTRTSRQAPESTGAGHRQRDPAAGLCQWAPPRRPDAGAAGLARHATRAVVRHAHGDPQPRSLSRHALFGLRDDRLRHHHGAAHSRLDAGHAARGRGIGRGDPRLRGFGMRVSYCYAVRDQNRLVYQADQEFVASLPEELQARCSAGSRASRSVSTRHWALQRSIRAPQQAPREDPARSGQPALVLRQGATELCDASKNMTRRCTCTCSRPPTRRNMPGGVATARRSIHRPLRHGEPRLTLGHGVWLNEKDIERMAEARAASATTARRTSACARASPR